MTTVHGFYTWANIEEEEMFLYNSDSNELGAVKLDDEMMKRAYMLGRSMVK